MKNFFQKNFKIFLTFFYASHKYIFFLSCLSLFLNRLNYYLNLKLSFVVIYLAVFFLFLIVYFMFYEKFKEIISKVVNNSTFLAFFLCFFFTKETVYTYYFYLHDNNFRIFSKISIFHFFLLFNMTFWFVHNVVNFNLDFFLIVLTLYSFFNLIEYFFFFNKISLNESEKSISFNTIKRQIGATKNDFGNNYKFSAIHRRWSSTGEKGKFGMKIAAVALSGITGGTITTIGSSWNNSQNDINQRREEFKEIQKQACINRKEELEYSLAKLHDKKSWFSNIDNRESVLKKQLENYNCEKFPNPPNLPAISDSPGISDHIKEFFS